ncbi:DUF305 domain-containing protein [Sphingomonas sp.]|uniref:DUF305 domain-containing protein n=1 Tax=Sphingomonas sp. TaxID=28214 RepID=UPI001B05041C|nr:DUF305 domain-containing protein [Sphingomonas sp.]MBO9711585.1 DUF305 domain-containing protein [Sphingomonas sp.]
MKNAYAMLAVNMVAGLAIMYLAMFAMIDGAADFFNNLNMLYMAVLMAAPMGMLMVATMPVMYPDRSTNLVLHVVFVLLFALALFGIRHQVGIGDRQFLRSMIPHHSGAILMCRKASLEDPDVVRLCERIQRSQREEIDEMNRLLARR